MYLHLLLINMARTFEDSIQLRVLTIFLKEKGVPTIYTQCSVVTEKGGGGHGVNFYDILHVIG